MQRIKLNKKEGPQERISVKPKTGIGKTSFWLVIFGFVILVFLDVFFGLMQYGSYCDSYGACYLNSLDSGFTLLTRIFPLVIAFGSIIIGGLTSFIAIIRYRDFSLSVFLSAFLGLFGLLFLIGEFLI